MFPAPIQRTCLPASGRFRRMEAAAEIYRQSFGCGATKRCEEAQQMSTGGCDGTTYRLP